MTNIWRSMAQKLKQPNTPLVGQYIPADEPIDFKAEPVALSEVETLHVLLRKRFEHKEREARDDLRKNMRMPMVFMAIGAGAYILDGFYSILKMLFH